MKKGVSRHPKTIRLAVALGINRHEATGLLNDLWEYTGDYAIEGDVGRHGNAEIALGIGWNGDPDALVNALIDCGWLDKHPNYRLLVHDWAHGCDQWVKHKAKRVKAKFIKSSGKKKRPDSVRTVNGQCPSRGDRGAIKDREGEERRGEVGATSNPPPDLHAFILRDKHPAIDPSLLEQAGFIEAWRLWLQNLKAKGKKPTAHAVDMQLRKLERMDHEQRIATIEHSIAGNYQGLFSPSGSGGPNRSDANPSRVAAKPDKYANVAKPFDATAPSRTREAG